MPKYCIVQFSASCEQFPLREDGVVKIQNAGEMACHPLFRRLHVPTRIFRNEIFTSQLYGDTISYNLFLDTFLLTKCLKYFLVFAIKLFSPFLLFLILVQSCLRTSRYNTLKIYYLMCSCKLFSQSQFFVHTPRPSRVLFIASRNSRRYYLRTLLSCFLRYATKKETKIT